MIPTQAQQNRAVFLDRDGVINISEVVDGKPYAPKKLEDFVLYNDTIEAVERLKQAGYLVIVVTNQPDVGNGKVRKEVVEQMHKKLSELTQIDDICVCYHSQNEGCDCRKPNPGMLLQSAKNFVIDLSASFIVGDRNSDIEAGKVAGCTTIFIDRQYDEPKPTTPDAICGSLVDAVNIVLNQNTMTN